MRRDLFFRCRAFIPGYFNKWHVCIRSIGYMVGHLEDGIEILTPSTNFEPH